MAIRPVDLQQTIMKAPDVTRDVSVQQQSASAQQAHMAQDTKRQAERAETVAQFDEEAAAVLVRERDAGEGQQQSQQRKQKQEGEADPIAEEAAAKAAAAQARVGRHIDLQA
ncbi:MAG TPA: hypothetical protein VK009_28280 [Chloroflexota bacterium]|nr:hypothetical protein [Chloroflexota bacterium]